MTRDIYRFSRLLYILEAALEYFIATAVGTVYLARVTAYIGMSDALTGILSAFVSLGCGFQLVAVWLVNRQPVKRWVSAGHIISQLLFALVYFVPLMSLTQAQKIVLFVIVFLSAHILHNMIQSPKINWFMSLVDNEHRGRFTANKEMVSLVGGILFSYALGAVMDLFEAEGDIRGAFVVYGIGILVLMLLHSATLLLSREKTTEKPPVQSKGTLRELLRNKTLLRIILVGVLWNIANYASISFMGTYQVKELAFSATLSSVILMTGSLVRACASRPMGRYADKTSFRHMLTLCFVIEAISFGINVFTSPANGIWMYSIYYILHCIGMAGINSAIINFIYDYVEVEERTGALALQQTCAGFAGFFIVLLVSPLVTRLQENALTIFGRVIYAQQLLSAISCVVTLLILIYLNTVIKKLKKAI